MPRTKVQTHHLRYLGKRGLVAVCGAVVTEREWVGKRCRPSCNKCRKLSDNR